MKTLIEIIDTTNEPDIITAIIDSLDKQSGLFNATKKAAPKNCPNY